MRKRFHAEAESKTDVDPSVTSSGSRNPPTADSRAGASFPSSSSFARPPLPPFLPQQIQLQPQQQPSPLSQQQGQQQADTGASGENPQPSQPIVSEQARELRRSFVVKYIERQADRLRRRPDLMYWRHCVSASFVDPDVERRVARPFALETDVPTCSSCHEEMWPSSQFCWNARCFNSPIYWQLPGAAGVPPPLPQQPNSQPGEVPSPSPRRRAGSSQPLASSSSSSSSSSALSGDGPPSCLHLYEDPVPNDVTTFLLLAPARVLTGGLPRRGVVEGEGERGGDEWVAGFHDEEPASTASESEQPLSLSQAQTKEPAKKRAKSRK